MVFTCIIGETLRPINFNILSEIIIKEVEGAVEVCDLGAYKATVVFNSKQRVVELMEKENDSFDKFFDEI